ncbi:MAG: hypothetical protein NVSMB52_05230 [Chloroflexota bacterium]
MPSPRGLVLLLLMVLMENLAGFSVLVGSSLLDATTAGYTLFWFLMLSGICGLVVGLMVARLGPGEPWNRIALLVGSALSAVLPAALLSHNAVSFLVSAVFLVVDYWRGILTTQEPPTYSQVQARFGMGFGLLFLGLLWIIARDIINKSWIVHMMALLGIAYIVIAMVALVTARMEASREPGAGQAVMLAVAVQLGLLLVLGLGALQIFSLDLAGALLNFTHPIWDVVGRVWFNFLLLLANPVQHSIDILRPHAHRGARINYQPVSTGHEGRGRHLKSNATNYPFVGFIALLFMLLLIGGIGVLIWRTIPRIPRRVLDHGFKERREHLWSMRMLWRAILNWFRLLLRRGMEVGGEIAYRTRRRVFGAYPSDPIRRMYAQMQRRATAGGVPRQTAMTPLEYRDALVKRWPDVAFNLSAVTNAYILRRYGDSPASEAEIEFTSHHWQHVRQAIRVPRMGQRTPSTSDSEGQDSQPQSSINAWPAWLPLDRLIQGLEGEIPGVSRIRPGLSLLLLAICLLGPLVLFLGFLLVAVVFGHA